MGTMSSPELIIRANEPIRPLKRVEYERLAKAGCFEDEQVELLFGLVVPMTPIDRAHVASAYRLRRILEEGLGKRAQVYEGSPFAASEISEPQPDLLVTESTDDWEEHPARALLVVEVARSSLRRDRGPKRVLYGLAEVDEYWIVNHADGVIEVYRDRRAGDWQTKRSYGRGERITMMRFPDVAVDVSDVLPPLEG